MSNTLLSLHCPKCGKKIADSDHVCPHCGTDLDAPLEPSELQALAQPYLEKAQKMVDSGGNPKAALRSIDQALEYLPESAEAHNLRGMILDAMGNAAESVTEFQAAVRLEPDFADAQENLVQAEAEAQENQQHHPSKEGLVKKFAIALIIGIAVLLVAGEAFVFYIVAWPFLAPKHTVVFEPDRSLITTVTPADLKKTADLLTQRWQSLGYGYPWVSFGVSDNGQIIGQIPLRLDRDFINRTKALGLVEFVDFGDTIFEPGTVVNTDFMSNDFPQGTGTKWHTLMSNAEIQNVHVSPGENKLYNVLFTLTPQGKQIFADHTSHHINKFVGIVRDKVVITAPRIQTAILDGSVQISDFTKDSAESLAAVLKTSPLPVPLK